MPNSGLNNASPYNLAAAAGATQLSAVTANVDVSQPLRGIFVFIRGQLATAAGAGADPAATLDQILKLMGTLQVRVNNSKSGNWDIIPAGIPFTRIANLFYTHMALNARRNAGWGQPPRTWGGSLGRPWTSTAGSLGASPENFLISFYLPFSGPGLNNDEMDLTCYRPKADDTAIQLILTPTPVVAGTVTPDYPFPGSTRAYTFNGFNATGLPQMLVFPDQVANPAALPQNAGAYLPRLQMMDLTLTNTSAVTQNLQNFERDGRFRLVDFQLERVTTATGATASTANNGSFANFSLRDWFLMANSTIIRQDDLMRAAMFSLGTQINDATGCGPFQMDFMRGQSFDSLPDWTALDAKIQLNMQFQNIINPGAGVNDILHVSTLRYLPRA